jgi:hypothetical protein
MYRHDDGLRCKLPSCLTQPAPSGRSSLHGWHGGRITTPANVVKLLLGLQLLYAQVAETTMTIFYVVCMHPYLHMSCTRIAAAAAFAA